MTIAKNISVKNYSGLILGLLIFFIILYAIPEGSMPASAQRMAAITSLMAVWWITEAIPIAATALLPIILYPLLKIMKTSEVTINYGHHLVFLFLGGFIIALTIERWNLHKRIALRIIYLIGNDQRRIILGFMIATAFLSMWISNTATTMMMIPIGLAIISQFAHDVRSTSTFRHGKNNFALALMLGIAYSASIGGISTLIGTPPNVVFTGILKANFPGAPEISFVRSLMFLPIAWFYLVFIAAPVKQQTKKIDNTLIRDELAKLGPMTVPERYTLIIFITTGLLWMLRSDIDLGSFVIPGWAGMLGLKEYVQDSTVAMFMAILTFVIPARESKRGWTFLMDWSYMKKIPWGILLLFGGGFAMASGFQESGLTLWLGEQLTAFQFLPILVIIILVCLMTTLTTEFASNTAMATTILPLVAGLGIALNINPMLLMIPATISSSTAFMLPVATPPNAIVFGSGYIRIKDMVRIGIVMNIIGLILIAFFVSTTAAGVFDINWDVLPDWVK
jgi:sodium-dependent dicarboxylate transporter 2/3/5